MRQDYIVALRILGWGAAVLAIGFSALGHQVEGWQILSTTP